MSACVRFSKAKHGEPLLGYVRSSMNSNSRETVSAHYVLLDVKQPSHFHETSLESSDL